MSSSTSLVNLAAVLMLSKAEGRYYDCKSYVRESSHPPLDLSFLYWISCHDSYCCLSSISNYLKSSRLSYSFSFTKALLCLCAISSSCDLSNLCCRCNCLISFSLVSSSSLIRFLNSCTVYPSTRSSSWYFLWTSYLIQLRSLSSSSFCRETSSLRCSLRCWIC